MKKRRKIQIILGTILMIIGVIILFIFQKEINNIKDTIGIVSMVLGGIMIIV